MSSEDMRKIWILYRVVPRLSGPMTAFAKSLGLNLPTLYREVLDESCFAYTNQYGYDNPATDLFFIGKTLRSYLLSFAEDDGRDFYLDMELPETRVFHFRHFGELEKANRIYLEKIAAQYTFKGDDFESAYCLLDAKGKTIIGSDIVEAVQTRPT